MIVDFEPLSASGNTMKNLFKVITMAGLMSAIPLGRSRFRAPLPSAKVRMVGSGADPETEALNKKTVKQLRAVATAMKIKGRSKARRKADLIALILRNGGTQC